MQQVLTKSVSGVTSTVSRVVRPAEVCERLGIGTSTLYAMMAAGKFPRPFVIFSGGRAVGWHEQEVEAWLQQRSSEAEAGHE